MNLIDAQVWHPNATIVTGQAVTTGTGIATFYFTHDGTGAGTPLLTTVYKAFVSSISTATNAIDVPSAEIREINIAGKYVSATARSFVGVTVVGISVLGSINFINGATIHFLVIGE